MEVNSLFEENQSRLRNRVDRVFGWLMLAQWAFVIILAWNSPNLWTTAVLSGTLVSLPLYFAFIKPGTWVGGYIMAVIQMGVSALLIYLMGGKIQAHFLVFASLAFLTMYRDWKLLTLASVIIILGVEWAWLDHVVWVLFETFVLAYTCFQATREMNQVAVIQSELMKERIASENLNIKRTQFFSVISHEIRTPLTGIIGFSDFLKESPIPEEQKEYVSIIKQCSDTLLKLVNDLLDFSRIESGKLDIDPHQFKVTDIQTYLENVFLLECKKKNLQFKFEIDADVPSELIGDSHRIRQVLSNIVGNAVKFTHSGGIHVKLCRQHHSNIYRWSVEDTGVGIKKDNLAMIFSPYTQEFSSTSRKYGGSGLGLAISKKLVELMGGHLGVESTLGKGTLFFFTTPLKQN